MAEPGSHTAAYVDKNWTMQPTAHLEKADPCLVSAEAPELGVASQPAHLFICGHYLLLPHYSIYSGRISPTTLLLKLVLGFYLSVL